MQIRPKDRDTLLQALRAGVVPRTGQHLIQVGRVKEVSALLGDLDRIAEGGSAFRLVLGDYGAGKTFFLNLVRGAALEKKLVTMHADLNPDRRLQGSGGVARSLYAELVTNMATRTRPVDGALQGVVEKFIAQARADAAAGGTTAEALIRSRLAELTEMVGGYDFADVLAAYCRGHEEGNETLMKDALRWLRGEFATKTDARAALGVRTIVDDDAVYDQIKLLSRFVRLAGYAGLLVCLDEMVNLYKLPLAQSRAANYEQILRILNDSLQGSAAGLGFIMGGTPEFLTDPRRGLYSYAALQSRLAENAYAAKAGIVDYTGPVLRLASLTQEDFFVLLQKLRHVQAGGDASRYLVTDEGIEGYMRKGAEQLGDAYFRTPRKTITNFMHLLATLDQDPNSTWESLVGMTTFEADRGAENDRVVEPATAGATASGDALAAFKL